MLKTVTRTIQQYNMLSPGDGVIVGLSGGADSVTLLSVLLALKDELRLAIYAAHINHNLRGRAARKDERLARLLCEKLGVPFFVFQADVRGFARENKMGTEEAGRKLRYKYLRQAMEDCGAQKIAVGHNQDDNAETVMLNLFRGAGLKGLCGIPPVNGQIIRPLLEVSRKKIEVYVKENRLPFVTDKTNFSSNYSRNLIRNEITPKIRKHFGDKVSGTIGKNAMLLRADEEALSAAAQYEKPLTLYVSDATHDEKLMAKQPLSLEIPLDRLLTQPLAIIRRIIREAISDFRGEKGLEDIESAHIESILDLAQGRSGREVSLPGFKARREYEKLVLFIDIPHEPSCLRFCHVLRPDSPIYIAPLTVILSLHPPKNIARQSEKNCEQPQFHCTQAFNYDKVNKPLEIRNRQPGDKIALPGGTKKLQDYFTDTKTPRNQRDTIPLLADGGNILWIMDKYNRISVAYKPEEGQTSCWVTAKHDAR